MTIICTVDSPVGLLTIKAEDNCLTDIDLFLSRDVQGATSQAEPLIKNIEQQFHDYFTDPAHTFTLDYHLRGTPFQQRVWQEMLTIPSSQVKTYGEIATKLNSSPRAVGNACRANPLPILVPCHRVVSQSGMGGYAGETSGEQLDVKRWLLRHEGAEVNGL